MILCSLPFLHGIRAIGSDLLVIRNSRVSRVSIIFGGFLNWWFYWLIEVVFLTAVVDLVDLD